MPQLYMWLDQDSMRNCVVSVADSWIAESARSLRALISLDKPPHLLLYRAQEKFHQKHTDTVACVGIEVYVVHLLTTPSQ